MHTRNTHPVICFIILTAYFFNVAAMAGGMVLCQNPVNGSSTEFVGSQEHCSTSTNDSHNHDSTERCMCAPCPCDDTPIVIDVVPVLRDDEFQTRFTKPLTPHYAIHMPIVRRSLSRISFLEYDRPALHQSLRQVRTIVLIL